MKRLVICLLMIFFVCSEVRADNFAIVTNVTSYTNEIRSATDVQLIYGQYSSRLEEVYCLDFSNHDSVCTLSNKYKEGDRISFSEITMIKIRQ